MEGDRSRAGARGRLTNPAQRARLLMVAAALGAIAAAASAQPAHAQALPSAQQARAPATVANHPGPRWMSDSSAAAARCPEASAPWIELVSRWSPQT